MVCFSPGFNQFDDLCREDLQIIIDGDDLCSFRELETTVCCIMLTKIFCKPDRGNPIGKGSLQFL